MALANCGVGSRHAQHGGRHFLPNPERLHPEKDEGVPSSASRRQHRATAFFDGFNVCLGESGILFKDSRYGVAVFEEV